LGEEGRKQLELITQRASRMSGLINGVLEYSRVGRKDEQYMQVDLNHILRELAEDLSPPQHIEIAFDEKLPVVWGEPTRIRQLFQNLMSNAVKYNDKEQGTIHVGCVDRSDLWEFFVADNGPGIPAEHFERIFQIFQMLSASNDPESTGVGLTVARKIVECHGGRMWVTSEVGRGSTFQFTWPKETLGRAHERETATATAGG
jgi:light-regulated signal transduction histidine kinase (bacteriophytochrome)